MDNQNNKLRMCNIDYFYYCLCCSSILTIGSIFLNHYFEEVEFF